MILYGDPSDDSTVHAQLMWLRERSARAATLDERRSLLVHAGRLEQAIADGPFLTEHQVAVSNITDAFAMTFLDALGGVFADVDVGRLSKLEALDDGPVTMRVPEGFAYYTLYPEAYIEAVREWLADMTPRGPILVVGVRSIGTTLSAVVLAALRRLGFAARRITVRPAGHPFRRRTESTADDCVGVAWVAVVDEGPGLSGSSMASVVSALTAHGLTPDRIVLLPGHPGMPGAEASQDVRAIWQRTRRYCVPTSNLRWNGKLLPDVLRDFTRGIQVEDVGGGVWRRWVASPGPFSVLKALERTKYIVRHSDGSALLWRFVGLLDDNAESIFGAPLQRSEWSAGAVARCRGFVARPWIDGEVPVDPTPDELRSIARYLRTAVGSPLTPEEARRARYRLVAMAMVNVREVLGEDASARFEMFAATAPELAGEPRYGDGRMSPIDWRRVSGGLRKVNAFPHDRDHTTIGIQPSHWDVASFVVEWRLGKCERDVIAAELPEIDAEVMLLYEIGYLAFRLAVVRFTQMTDLSEANLAKEEEGAYRGQLANCLARMSTNYRSAGAYR